MRVKIGIGPARIFLLCAVVSLLVYVRAFDNPFRQDDFVYLRHVETHTFGEALKPAQGFAFYRPGSVALFYLEHEWFGSSSGAYIACNYVLHLLVSLLAVMILLRFGADPPTAAAAGGLFLVGFAHYGKQVMWACAGGSILSVLLSLASVLLTLRLIASRTREGAVTAGIARFSLAAGILLLLVLAALCNAGSLLMCILVSILIMVSEWRGRASKLVHSALFLIPVPLLIGFWLAVMRTFSGSRTMGSRILASPGYLVRYLGYMVVPIQSSPLMGASPALYGLCEFVRYLHVILGVAILLILVYLALRSGGILRILGISVIVALLPFAFVRLPGDWLELRYLYCASIPFCGLSSMAIFALSRRKRLVWRAVAGVMTICMILGTIALQLALENSYDFSSQGTERTLRDPLRSEERRCDV